MVKNIPPKFDFSFEQTQIRIYHANEGEGLAKHDHVYEHGTVCYSGRLLVTKDNLRLEMTKDTPPVVLAAGEWHELEAIEDGTVFSNIFDKKFMG